MESMFKCPCLTSFVAVLLFHGLMVWIRTHIKSYSVYLTCLFISSEEHRFLLFLPCIWKQLGFFLPSRISPFWFCWPLWKDFSDRSGPVFPVSCGWVWAWCDSGLISAGDSAKRRPVLHVRPTWPQQLPFCEQGGYRRSQPRASCSVVSGLKHGPF